MSSDDQFAGAARDHSREGWQGRRAAASYTAPEYRWQGGGGADVERQVSRPRRRQRWWLTFWLLILWTLFGFYVALLAYAPRRVPIVVAMGTAYELPLPPNAWAAEDLELLKQLAGQNLRVIDTSPQWKSRSAGLGAWEQQVRELARHGSPSHVALFYVSMHGAVDEQGRACLIPPGVSPLESTQWIPLEEFLRPLSQLPGDWRKVVFLDASRQTANWRMGTLESTFADRLPSAIEKLALPGLVVVNSAGPEQQNWSSPDLAGSVFGREVALGLAGVADFPSTDPQRVAGNSDGQVTFDELTRYLNRRCRLWALRNRAAIQTPVVAPAGAPDFALVKSLHRADSQALRTAQNSRPRTADSVAAEEIAPLWRTLDALRPLHPEQGEPLAWRDLEHRLLWLEQLAAAGAAYSDQAQALRRELSSQLQRAREAAEGLAERTALADRVGLLDPRAADWPRQLPVRSLPFGEYLGVLDRRDATRLREQLDDLAESADPAQFDARLRAALRVSPRPDVLINLVETQALRLAQQYRVPRAWNGAVPLQRLLDLRRAVDQLAAGSEERSHLWTRWEFTRLDDQRRLAEDRVFAGPEASGPEPWRESLDALEREAQPTEGRLGRFRAALETRDVALARLPYLAQWLASSEPLGKPLAGTAQDPIAADFASAWETAQVVSRRLETIPSDQSATSETNELLDAASRLAQQLAELDQRFEQRCQELLADARNDAPTVRGLEAALASPLPRADLRQQLQRKLATLAARLHDAANQRALGRAKEEIPDPTPLEGSRERQASWPIHPALAMLGLPSERASSLGTAPQPMKAPPAAQDDKSSSPADGDSAASSEAPAPAVSADQLAVWERAGQRARQRLLELSRWSPPVGIRGAESASSSSSSASAPDASTARGASETQLTKADSSSSGAAPSTSDAAEPKSSDSSASPGSSASAATESAKPKARDDASDTGDSGPASLAVTRRELARAESDLRAAAALGFPAPEDNAVRWLRRFDLQQLLIWQAERAIGDFWGAGRRDRNESAPETPYFVAAVRDYLRAAELVLPPASAVRQQIADLDATVQTRLESLADYALELDTSEPAATAEQMRFRARVTRKPNRDAAAAGVRPVSGMATVLVRQGAEFLAGPRGTVEWPGDKADSAWQTVESTPDPNSGAPLRAVLVYRGHEWTQPVQRRGSGGAIVRYEPASQESAQVTLFGQRRQQASILFILDCSASMNRPILVEAVGGDEQPRMEVAKSVLQEFLEQLAERGDTRVGVRFFGHRVGWTKSQPVKILTQTDYTGTIPNELAPSEDVELVLPLGRFGPVEAGRVVRLLPGVKAWGQSPLYLSLTQALADFESDRSETDKSIVVITDGGNYQFVPSAQPVRGRPKTTVAEIQQAWRGRRVPVHIVGFGLDNSPELAAAETEFQQIADTTGGQYVPVSNGQDLLRVLRSQLGVGGYRVLDERGAPVSRGAGTGAGAGGDAASVRLNQPVRLSGLGGGPKKFRLEFESLAQPLVLEGGEAIEFDLAGDGQQILSRAYGANVAGTLPLALGSRRMLARWHRPVADREGMTFRVSFQDENLEFTRRPDEVWIEITPVISATGSTGPTYVFYERNFEARTPVPVVVCRVPNWPAAGAARVTAWCKFSASPQVLARPLDQIVRAASGTAEESVPGVPGIRFRAEVIAAGREDEFVELRVTERHEASSPGLNSLRVQLDTPLDLGPQVVERSSDAEGRLVTHTWSVRRDRWQRLQSDPRAKLVMSTREAAREGAWRADGDRSLTVDVSLAGETLPVQPAR